MRQLGYLACQRFCLIFTKRDACEFKNQHGLACGVHTHSGKRLFENKRGVRLCANKKDGCIFDHGLLSRYQTWPACTTSENAC